MFKSLFFFSKDNPLQDLENSLKLCLQEKKVQFLEARLITCRYIKHSEVTTTAKVDF